MTSHSDQDIYQMSNLQLVKLFRAMNEAVARRLSDPDAATNQEITVLQLEFIRSLPRADRFLLLDLVREWPTQSKAKSPGRSAPSLSHHAPGNERPTARGI